MNEEFLHIDNSISDSLLKAREFFNQDDLFRKIVIPNFDCSLLVDPRQADGKNLPEIIKSNFFKYLHQYDHSDKMVNDFPCLYVFELQDKSDCKRVVEALKKVKSENIGRILPPFKTKIPESKYLYVGKVQREVGGRMVTHLGYYNTTGNHGLQLAFWAKDMIPSLQITVSIYRFKSEMTPYISSFEKILADKLKPIIGKHK